MPPGAPPGPPIAPARVGPAEGIAPEWGVATVSSVYSERARSGRQQSCNDAARHEDLRSIEPACTRRDH